MDYFYFSFSVFKVLVFLSFFYRLGIKDGLRSKSTVKSVLEMMPGNREWMENICYDQKDAEHRY